MKQISKKCFQTDFKVEFRGVLQRTFAGIEAVKEFEVNFIRPVLEEEAFDVPGLCDILKWYGRYHILVQKVFERDLSRDGKCKKLKL